MYNYNSTSIIIHVKQVYLFIEMLDMCFMVMNEQLESQLKMCSLCTVTPLIMIQKAYINSPNEPFLRTLKQH